MLIVAMVAYSFCVLCRETDKRVWRFIITLAGFMAVALLAVDVVANHAQGALVISDVGAQIWGQSSPSVTRSRRMSDCKCCWTRPWRSTFSGYPRG